MTKLPRILMLGASMLLSAIAATAPADQGASKPADHFEVRLGLTHGHLREVYFGCAPGASNGFDPQFDSMAPPPGRATGYTAFVMPEMPGVYLYKDIRASDQPELAWTFLAQVYEDKVITISWEPQTLPPNYSFAMHLSPSRILDMRQNNHVQISQSQSLRILAKRRAADASGAEATTEAAATATDAEVAAGIAVP